MDTRKQITARHRHTGDFVMSHNAAPRKAAAGWQSRMLARVAAKRYLVWVEIDNAAYGAQAQDIASKLNLAQLSSLSAGELVSLSQQE